MGIQHRHYGVASIRNIKRVIFNQINENLRLVNNTEGQRKSEGANDKITKRIKEGKKNADKVTPGEARLNATERNAEMCDSRIGN